MTETQDQDNGSNSNKYLDRHLSGGKISLPPALRTHYYLIPIPGSLPDTDRSELRLYPKGTTIHVDGEVTDEIRRINMTTNGQLTIPKRHREKLSFYDMDESKLVAVYPGEDCITITEHPDPDSVPQ